MSCGREIKTLGEGAKGHGPLPPPPNPHPQSLKGFLPGEVEADSPAFSGPDKGWGGGREGSCAPLPSPHEPMLSACGLDFGSRYVKLVYADAQGALGRRRLDTIIFYRDYLIRGDGRLRHGLAAPASCRSRSPWWSPATAKISCKKISPPLPRSGLISWGPGTRRAWTILSCWRWAARTPRCSTSKDGRVFDFLTNDRCAAGTGRYLENMARFLKMPLTRFAAAWQDPVEISQTCAIFGESELVGHLLEGVDPARIAAGVNASVARRALALVRRYHCPTLVCVGGVARNRAVIHFLREPNTFRVQVPPHPQFNGALGCCLEAARRLAQGGP